MSEERNSFKRLEEEAELPPGGEKELKGTVSFIHSVSRVPHMHDKDGEKRRDSENSPSEPPL